MPIKSVFLPDYIQVNQFQLIVTGLPPLTPTMIGSLESELDNVDLPDRTTQSGGRTKPVEFEIAIPSHHVNEIAAMELWFTEAHEPILPTHKKVGTLIIFSQTGLQTNAYTLVGLYVFKRATPELELDNDGEMAVTTYTLKADDVLKIS